MTDVWFRYREDGKSYYYNSSTHETTWKFPLGKGSVWDAESKRKLKLPTQTKLKPPPAPKPPASDDSDEEEYDEQSNSAEGSDAASPQGSDDSEGPSGPSVIDYSQELVDKYAPAVFEFAKFEAEHMNKLKKDKFSNSDKVIDAPLLSSTKKASAKTAIKNYKLILKQGGITVKGLKGNESLLDLIQSLNEDSGLVDETYAGVWKQTINCKKDMLVLLLDLFLILATSFKPSSFMSIPLLKHLATISENRYARFVLIRLYDTLSRNEPLMKCKSEGDIKTILDHYKKGVCLFHVSHYEAFFNQYIKRPAAPIPFIEYQLLENVREQGGRDKQSIFRSAGNKKNLDTLVQEANKGEDVLEGQNVDEVAALFKRWLDFMPGKLIHSSYKKKFQEATSDDTDSDLAIAFANELPPSIQVVLKYLVGYLRDFSENSSVNQMDLEAFATLFGRIILFEDEKADPIKFQQSQKFFMKSLLEKWDIGNVYPVNAAAMKSKK